jgi:hypothetical protein
MTADTAIRIDLHSAEVVHFPHTIRLLIVWASSLRIQQRHDKHPVIAFRLSTLVWGPTLWSMYLPGIPWQSTSVERNSSATARRPIVSSGGSGYAVICIALLFSGNPDSGIPRTSPAYRVPLYSCEVPHTKINKTTR